MSGRGAAAWFLLAVALCGLVLVARAEPEPRPHPLADPGYYGSSWYYGYYNDYKNSYYR